MQPRPGYQGAPVAYGRPPMPGQGMPPPQGFRPPPGMPPMGFRPPPGMPPPGFRPGMVSLGCSCTTWPDIYANFSFFSHLKGSLALAEAHPHHQACINVLLLLNKRLYTNHPQTHTHTLKHLYKRNDALTNDTPLNVQWRLHATTRPHKHTHSTAHKLLFFESPKKIR